MPIVGTDQGFIAQRSAVRLARYAQIIDKNEGAFWGVFNVPGQVEEDCHFMWTQRDRRNIAKYLAEAQDELETEIRYPLMPKWIAGKLSDQFDGNIEMVDTQEFRKCIVTRWARIIAPGIRAETIIEDNIAITDPNVDPYQFVTTVAAPAGTTTDEIRIYHPGSFDEITPSSIEIDGAGLVTVEVPRVRTVKPEFVNTNSSNAVDYTDIAKFMSEARITREYNDPSVNAEIAKKHTCTSSCSEFGCSETTQTGCIYVEDGELGIIDVVPSTFSNGTWSSSSISCCLGEIVRLNYLAGTKYLSPQSEDAIIRLSHAKMPNEPCGCTQALILWRRDRDIPTILTREQINNPFGSRMAGAWVAWRWSQTMKVYRMGFTF